jgi:hypothetical protein
MERLNIMTFDPCNCSLKIWESTRTPTPKVGVPLGVWGFIPSHSFALPGAWNVTPGFPSWPALLQALALVASPRLRLRHTLSFLFVVVTFLCQNPLECTFDFYYHLKPLLLQPFKMHLPFSLCHPKLHVVESSKVHPSFPFCDPKPPLR